MSTPHDQGASAFHDDDRRGRRMNRRRRDAAKRKKRSPFKPFFHTLEKRMMLATFLVSTAADSGAGSLRQAILNSNAAPGSNTIDFGIGTGAQTISLLSALPNITVPVLIDGTTQPGYTTAPLIDLDGTGAGSSASGLDLAAGSGGSTIRALVIDNFAADGIVITTTGNIVQRSYIGTNAAGTAVGSQAMTYGIVDTAGSNNTIGGTTAGAGNLISGNSEGILLQNALASDNLVVGNLIGTDITGKVALPNLQGVGVFGAPGNTIGGTTSGAANLVSGNSNFGVVISGGQSTGNIIAGNKIGTDITGTLALSDSHGVEIANGATNNTVGGLTGTPGTGAGNLISGNTAAGVYMGMESGNVVAGNLIGTDITGAHALSNDFGVYFDIDTTNNTVGGTAAGAGNLISGNVDGIDNATTDVIAGNKIGTDITGTVALPNTTFGVILVSNSTIGGTAAGAGNLISGNKTGILAFGGANLIEGNLVGTNATGLTALGNTQDGIDVKSSAETIGGTAAGAGNTIAFNTDDAVNVITGTGDAILENLIYRNGSGIVLASGANNNQIAPVITGVTSEATAATASQTSISVDLTAAGFTSGSTYSLDFFASGLGDPSSGVQAHVYLGTQTFTGGATGNVMFTLPMPLLSATETVTATATLLAGSTFTDTSSSATAAAVAEISNITVTTTAATGVGSLEQAILDANADTTLPMPYTITFAITPGSAPFTITLPSGGLTSLTRSVALDATSQSGYTGSPIIVLNGTGVSGSGLVLSTGSDGSLVRGFDIIDFTRLGMDGIDIDSSGNAVQASYVGVQTGGSTSAEDKDGVLINGSNNTIGGTTPHAGNLISGNNNPAGTTEGIGVEINGSSATGNTVEGNLIGTDITGILDLPNYIGVYIATSASGNTIGGSTAAARNVISGNTVDGVFVDLAGGNLIEGNLIGTDVTGSVALGNLGDGVELQGSNNDTVGGTTAAARNVISASGQFNLYIVYSADETVQGNYIGTDATGTFALDTDTFTGIEVLSSSDNLIGGTAPGAGNVISGTAYGGIIVSDYYGGGQNPQVTDGNTIQGNLIGLNASGTAALPNGSDGIFVGNSLDTQIGGLAPGAGNVIAGSQAVSVGPGYDYPAGSNGDGILVQGSAPGIAIEDNRIGTDLTGTDALPNQGSGVYVANTTATISGNQIAGNGYDGITVQGSGAPNGLTGLWSADGTTFDSQEDTDGTLLGGATYAPGISGQAFSFDGTSGAFEDNSNFSPPGGRIQYPFGATMAAWINTTAASGTLMTDGGGIDTQSGMGLFLQNGHLEAIGSKGTAGQFNFDLTSAVTVNDGQWHLVAVTWDGTTSAGGVTLYIDGAQVATGTALATLGNLGTGNDGASSLLYFGGDPNLALPYYKGLMDEVAVYSSAVSAADMATMYSVRGVAESASAATITGNQIGTNASGTAALANSNDGIDLVGSSFNVVGGTTPAAANLISGNTTVGIQITGAGATTNVVEGNLIGTGITGTVAIANATGVEIDTGASGNTIGGLTATPGTGAGNVISGNMNNGVEIDGTATTGNVVAGNLIGTDSTGTVAIANATGVQIDTGASGNTIGGSSALSRNVISGNTGDGVFITETATGNAVEGDYIGTDVTGTLALPNFNGVLIDTGASGNTIGGSSALTRNIISGNSDDGVVIDATGTGNNLVAGNYIGLGPDGTTAVGNALEGVFVVNSGTGNTIGGLTSTPGTGLGNVIGNQLSFYNSYGIALQGNAAVSVLGNVIGLNAAGNAAPNTSGVRVFGSSGNVIGGGLAGSANVLSGNADYGILLTNGSAFNLVQGNLIGTDATGTVERSNGGSGVYLTTGSNNNVIGTNGDGVNDATEGNVIAGTAYSLVNLDSVGTNNNVIAGNAIGTDRTGTLAMGGTIGIQVNAGVQNTRIGTNADGVSDIAERNLINGNIYGVQITGTGATGNTVAGNYIGVAADGVTARGNTSYGVLIQGGATGNTIGGLTSTPGTEAGNVISGNTGAGITISDTGTSGNAVEGNLIGTKAGGTSALANSTDGVLIQTNASSNTIGGTAAGAGNVISGDTTNGVEITGTGTSSNVVEGDYIGTDLTGTVAIANATGVEIDTSASGNTIGGSAAAARNIISGNSYGVTLNDTTSDAVEGNFIGTDLTGSIAVANGIGVLIWASATGNTIGGPATMTGTAPGNVISGNSGPGIFFDNNVASTGDLVEGNLIGTNAAGTAALGNGVGNGGIYILSDGSATHETIGGTAAADRNVISGNNGAGIDILNDNSNLIEGNYVGLDITGASAVPNLDQGIQIVGSNDNTVGGTAPGAGNVISGNRYNATAGQQVVINDENLATQTASGNLVQGNLIGTNAADTGLPSGMSFDYDGTGVEILGCATGNTIGGTTAGAANVIAGNATGVFIGSVGFLAGGTTSGNVVEGNDIGVEANGTTALANTVGVLIQSGAGNSLTDDNTLGGATAVAANIISGNTTFGIEISGSTATGNVVEGDYIGTDLTGTVAIANGTGVEIDTSATGNTIGGLTSTAGTGAGNVISGNSNYGVWVVAATSNAIEGNLIGTGATGTVAVANGLFGVNADTGANNTTVGGTVAGAGNVISGNTSYGVVINSSGSLVAGNLIGLNRAGTTAVANLSSGIKLVGANNTVGGITAVARNVVSGNTQNGILVTGVGATGNLIEGNYVGTNAVGSAAVPNNSVASYRGILINSGAQNTTVGGSTAGAGNLLSGNLGWGLEVDGPVTANTVIQGNLIGTDATGTFAVGNGFSGGIIIYRAISTTIGGTTAAARNLVSGNQSAGILAEGTGLSQLLIEGNYIGTNSAGSAAIPNNDTGVYVEDLAANVTIGSAVAGGGNLISGNGYCGIYVTNQDGVGVATNVVIQNNSIGTNASGTGAIPNLAGAVGGTGVYAGSGVIIYNVPNVVVGGSSANTRNLISGNAAYGVAISGSASTGNQIFGNFIGSDVSGTVSLGNATGVIIQSGATSDTIGGTAVGAGNLISGNTTFGVQITGAGATSNVVEGNLIGTGITGTVAIANATGVELDTGATGNTIGGTSAGREISFRGTSPMACQPIPPRGQT